MKPQNTLDSSAGQKPLPMVANSKWLSFLSYLGHELRSPLTAMRLQVQIAQRGILKQTPALIPESIPDLLEKCNGLLGNMARLLDDMNLLVGAQQGRRDGYRALVDAAELIQHVIEAHQAELRSVQYTLHENTSPDTKLFGDRDLLERVLSHLLLNALRYRSGDTIHMGAYRIPRGMCFVIAAQRPIELSALTSAANRCWLPPRDASLGVALHFAAGAMETCGGELWVDGEGVHWHHFALALPLSL